mmetsp:Transcript_46191/g.119045  ORF Transcript_46191/g.119045 Transcript_46191/m.119045 type:complete len:254 (-) Transcript_46191:1772-2533(-)
MLHENGATATTDNVKREGVTFARISVSKKTVLVGTATEMDGIHFGNTILTHSVTALVTQEDLAGLQTNGTFPLGRTIAKTGTFAFHHKFATGRTQQVLDDRRVHALLLTDGHQKEVEILSMCLKLARRRISHPKNAILRKLEQAWRIGVGRRGLRVLTGVRARTVSKRLLYMYREGGVVGESKERGGDGDGNEIAWKHREQGLMCECVLFQVQEEPRGIVLVVVQLAPQRIHRRCPQNVVHAGFPFLLVTVVR